MKGTIENVNQEGKFVIIDGNQHKLADHVNISFVKEGYCEYTVKNGEISFIKKIVKQDPYEKSVSRNLKIQTYSNLSGVDLQNYYNEFSQSHNIKFTQTHIEAGKWFTCIFYE